MKVRRSLALALVLAAFLMMPLAAEAQPTAKMPHIGYLWSGSPGSDTTEITGLRQGLRELGYVEGHNVAIDSRYADGNLDRVPGFIAELINLKVAVLVTPGTPVTAAAKHAAVMTPVVTVSNDPVGSGFAQSLGRPGGTITGLSMALEAGFSGKWLDLVREAVPTAARLAVIWNPTNLSNAAAMKEIQALASRLGLQLSVQTVRSPDDIDAAFAAVTKMRADPLIIITDPSLSSHPAQIVRLAAVSRIPTVYGLGVFVDAGGLMSYGPSLFDLFRRAAYFVDKILKGAKPAELPVEQPTKFALVINLKTAKALGRTIQPSRLLRADQVIE